MAANDPSALRALLGRWASAERRRAKGGLYALDAADLERAGVDRPQLTNAAPT